MFLQEKVVILTGASSGIGRALAYKLAEKGAKLVLVSRNENKLTQLSKELNDLYSIKVLVLARDLTQKDDIESTVEDAMKYFARIDFLINCSGIGSFKKAIDYSYDEMDYMFKLNVYGMMYLAQLVAREMIIQSIPGHIFFVASVAGKIATANSSVYSASKFAIIGYSNSLRLELKRFSINVTTINPGPTQTDFFSHEEESQDYFEQVKWLSLKPEDLAEDIVEYMNANKVKREITRPRFFTLVDILYKLFPKTGDYLAGDLFNFKENQ
ncbi:SDR family NAD(P)-dependent oxidoreductase [Aerococcaceae bacterium WGS1372]